MEPAEKQKQLSLLLVDDDIELCGMMTEFFAGAGHHLDCAHNGRDGLDRAVNGTYDLAILDVRSEEHTSELQSLRHLVWRLLPEKNESIPKRRQGIAVLRREPLASERLQGR